MNSTLFKTPRSKTLRDIAVIIALAAGIVFTAQAAGCAGVTYTAKEKVEFVLVTGAARADEGCRINIFVDGRERFVLAENPNVDCVVTDTRVSE